jgi:predicted CXXCH cytochrome family protein
VSCSDCHLVNEDLTVSRPRTHSDANPCYGCHQSKIGEFDQDYVHGPVAGGACTICHDPHGSDFADTLNQPAVLLCLSCHEDQVPGRFEVEHQPFTNGQCVDCHDPHSTMNRWVLVRSSEQLCFPCHGADGEIASHQHPYNVKPRRKLEVALQLTPSGRLECLSCHEAHGGSQRAMLRSPTADLCVGCHPRHW